MNRVVEGRTICPICKTDKSWAFVVDALTPKEKQRGMTLKQLIADSVDRQNEQVVFPHHQGHLDKLERTVETQG